MGWRREIERRRNGWRGGGVVRGTWKGKIADSSLALIFEETNEKRLNMSVNKYVEKAFHCFQNLWISIVMLTIKEIL